MKDIIDEKTYNKIINEIMKILNNNCDERRIKYHIIPVVDNAKKLAKELDANIQIVEISAYLHDITRKLEDQDKQQEHQITGAEFAESFLSDYNIPFEIVLQIKNCIIKHRGTINNERITIEEKIISTADAMSHIEHPLSFFYKWYGEKRCNLDDGALEIKKKLQRSWNKIEFEFAKEIVKEKYSFLLELLNDI